MSEVAMDQQQQEVKDESVLEEAKNYLVQGKRFMALEDYQSATDHLEQAVQLYDAYYGVGKIQCADAYLEYGLALVALANLEAGSGTDKIMKKAGIDGEEEEGAEDEEGEDEDDDEEANDDSGEGVIENEGAENKKADEQNGTEAAQSNESGEADRKTVANGQVAMETSGSSQELSKTMNGVHGTASTDASEPMPGTSSGKTTENEVNGDEEEENEATTIEIAWEVLCLAKRLFMTDESRDGRLKLAETYQKLGEISIEWDNNDNAVDILNECLSIRKAILTPEDRLIALTYYHLGLAHSFKNEIQNANENFQNAVGVIEKRIEALNEDLGRARKSQDTIVVSAYEKEINELRELLPDIMMRMDDSKEDQEKSTEVLKRTREEIQQEDEQVKKVLLDTSKPVDDITHLVKRKAA